ncbi:MAG: alpha/beta hydrolase-fold protein [Bacteroidota bacterium]
MYKCLLVLVVFSYSCQSVENSEKELSPGGEQVISNYYSEVLEDSIKYQIYLPHSYSESAPGFPVLYLLHGHGGDETVWFSEEKGNVIPLFDSLIHNKIIPPVITVSMDAGNSWYVDGPTQMQTAYLEEFIPFIESTYNIDESHDSRFIAGISAGGFGALRFSMIHPELFRSVILLSPASYLPAPPEVSSARKVDAFSIEGYFNDELWQSYSYLNLLDIFLDSEVKPEYYISSGDDDKYNIAPVVTNLQQLFLENDVSVELRITDGGHDWDCWRPVFEEWLPKIF